MRCSSGVPLTPMTYSWMAAVRAFAAPRSSPTAAAAMPGSSRPARMRVSSARPDPTGTSMRLPNSGLSATTHPTGTGTSRPDAGSTWWAPCRVESLGRTASGVVTTDTINRAASNPSATWIVRGPRFSSGVR